MREISDDSVHELRIGRAAKALGWVPECGEPVWLILPGSPSLRAGWATEIHEAFDHMRVKLKLVHMFVGTRTPDVPFDWVYPRTEEEQIDA